MRHCFRQPHGSNATRLSRRGGPNRRAPGTPDSSFMPDNKPVLNARRDVVQRDTVGDVPLAHGRCDSMAQGDESISTDVVVAVLAAGRGRRMRSGTPKHLHLIAGVPIVERAIRAGIDSGARETLVVVSPNMKDIDQLLGLEGKCTPVVQEPARGTADAVRHALCAAGDATWLVSLLGDNPLLTGEVVRELVARAKASGSLLTLLTSVPVSYTHLRAHETVLDLVCRLLLEK